MPDAPGYQAGLAVRGHLIDWQSLELEKHAPSPGPAGTERSDCFSIVVPISITPPRRV